MSVWDIIAIIFVFVILLIATILICRFIDKNIDKVRKRPVYKAYATVVKISQGQDIGGISQINSYTDGRVYGSGFVSGDTYEQVVFETEDGKRLSFRMSLAENIYNVGDRGLLLYSINFLGGNRFMDFRLMNGEYEEKR